MYSAPNCGGGSGSKALGNRPSLPEITSDQNSAGGQYYPVKECYSDASETGELCPKIPNFRGLLMDQWKMQEDS